jgi:hypothetical protein
MIETIAVPVLLKKLMVMLAANVMMGRLNNLIFFIILFYKTFR